MRRNFIALALFAVVSLGLLGALAAQLGVFSGGRGTPYVVRLDDAGGLVAGNSVRIAGVEVGKITRISLADNRAVVEIRIERDVPLYGGDCAKPRPKSLLGEKYLHLDQGSAAAGAPLAAGAEIECTRAMVDIGDALEGLAPILHSEEDMYPMVVKLLKRLDALTAGLEGALENGPAQEGLVGDVRELVRSGRDMLEENRGNLREMSEAGKKLLTDPRLSRSIGNLARVSEELERETPKLLARLDRAVADLEAVAARVDKNLDEATLGKARTMVDNGDKALADLRDASASLKKMAEQGGGLVKNLTKLAERAASITERDIRSFFQEQGMRVRVFVDREARRRIKELETQDGG